MRFGLEVGLLPRTLQELGDYFRVSRERVRQLEASGLKKLRKNLICQALADGLEWLVERAGGVLALDDATTTMQAHFHCSSAPVEHVIRLLRAINQNLERVQSGNQRQIFGTQSPREGPIYALPKWASKFPLVINTAYRAWRERQTTIQSDKRLQQVGEALMDDSEVADPKFILACLRADARFDPAHFEYSLRRLTLEEALEETLQQHGAPLHFTILTEKLNDLGIWHREANLRSVHGRLGAHPQLFVCVDRGTYGLLSWGVGKPTANTRYRSSHQRAH